MMVVGVVEQLELLDPAVVVCGPSTFITNVSVLGFLAV